MKDKIADALLKVALGFQVAEVTEEYAEVDGALKLTKRKRTKKDVPPDLKAVQMLLEEHGGSIENMSDEELEEEKKRLLAALEKSELKMEKEAGQVRDETGTRDKEKRIKQKEERKKLEEIASLAGARKDKEVTVKKPRAKPRKRVNRKKEDTK